RQKTGTARSIRRRCEPLLISESSLLTVGNEVPQIRGRRFGFEVAHRIKGFPARRPVVPVAEDCVVVKGRSIAGAVIRPRPVVMAPAPEDVAAAEMVRVLVPVVRVIAGVAVVLSTVAVRMSTRGVRLNQIAEGQTDRYDRRSHQVA